MFRRYYNLVLMVVWLVAGVLSLFPGLVFPERQAQRMNRFEVTLFGLLALMFAVYNAVRWWSYRALRRNRPAVPVNPLAVRRVETNGERDDEPNPAFDFSKPAETDGSPPRPSVNGDHHAV